MSKPKLIISITDRDQLQTLINSARLDSRVPQAILNSLEGELARAEVVSAWEVPADVVQRERDIQTARAKESGKPPEIAAKMVEGALNKFLGEITLLGQPFVKDDKQTVEKMLAARKGKVHAYAFFVVGEGIEKKSTDFAAEVMAQAGKAH